MAALFVVHKRSLAGHMMTSTWHCARVRHVDMMICEHGMAQAISFIGWLKLLKPFFFILHSGEQEWKGVTAGCKETHHDCEWQRQSQQRSGVEKPAKYTWCQVLSGELPVNSCSLPLLIVRFQFQVLAFK